MSKIQNNIEELLSKSLNEVVVSTHDYTALKVIITKLRNGVLNDKYDKKEQREYLKLLTDWIKMIKDKEDKEDLYTGIILK